MSHNPNYPQPEEEEFFMVFAEGGEMPRKRHALYIHATAEAERLAAKMPGQKFYILHAVESVQSMRVQRTKLMERVPF
jgi:hypothetical protein